MPERAYIVYKVSKPALDRSRSYNIILCLTQLSMECLLFINVKKCWHLNSIFEIGVSPCKQVNIFVQVNILVFTGS